MEKLTNSKLTWDIVEEKFEKLVRFSANDVASQYRTVYQNSDDLYQDGMILLWNCLNKYSHKSLEEFGYIFKPSLWRELRKHAGHEQKVSMAVGEVIDRSSNEEDDELVATTDMFGEVMAKITLEKAVKFLKDDKGCMLVLNELLNPSERTKWEMQMDYARKEMIQSQGKKTMIPKNYKITLVHIARALEISQGSLEILMYKIRLVFANIDTPEKIDFNAPREKVVREVKPKEVKPDWKPLTTDRLVEFAEKAGLTFKKSQNNGIQRMWAIAELNKAGYTPEQALQA